MVERWRAIFVFHGRDGLRAVRLFISGSDNREENGDGREAVREAVPPWNELAR